LRPGQVTITRALAIFIVVPSCIEPKRRAI
jgi:hypothetical protein